MATTFVDIDPRLLKLPTSRISGADPFKLHRQIARFGKSQVGMPVLEVVRSRDGELIIYNGVTRATRIAKLDPGATVRVEITGDVPDFAANRPSVEDRL